ncbi:AAA family ATPase [Dankookia sp. P2]|uniref:AAA family ATPase n=1 Tax=Dankookia sp. P2 TaxID=3423955 RepID=UPI003D669E3D
MPLGTLGLLVGPGGVGKSLVALDLCLAVAIGTREKLGRAVSQRPLGGWVRTTGASVFLTLEDDRAEIHRRTVSLDPEGHRHGAPCYVIPAVDLPEFDPALVSAEGRAAALTKFALEDLDRLLGDVARQAGYPVRLLVLDPAGDFINADENDATFVKVLMRHLRAAASRHRCTIILLGHVAKTIDAEGPSMRGNGAWVANSRFTYSLWRTAPSEAAELQPQARCPSGNTGLGKPDEGKPCRRAGRRQAHLHARSQYRSVTRSDQPA